MENARYCAPAIDEHAGRATVGTAQRAQIAPSPLSPRRPFSLDRQERPYTSITASVTKYYAALGETSALNSAINRRALFRSGLSSGLLASPINLAMMSTLRSIRRKVRARRGDES